MLGFFCLVAIFNLMLGYFLALVLSPAAAGSWIGRSGVLRFFPSVVRRLIGDAKQTEIEAHVEVPIGEPGAAPAPSPQETVSVGAASDGGASASSPAAEMGADEVGQPIECDWSELDSGISRVTDRIVYVRSIQDKGLARTAAEDFQKLVSSWHGDISRQLEGEGDAQLDDNDAMALEQFVAQLETTLANLQCIDWSEDLEAILDRLEKETRTLVGSRPKIGVPA